MAPAAPTPFHHPRCPATPLLPPRQLGEQEEEQEASSAPPHAQHSTQHSAALLRDLGPGAIASLQRRCSAQALQAFWGGWRDGVLALGGEASTDHAPNRQPNHQAEEAESPGATAVTCWSVAGSTAAPPSRPFGAAPASPTWHAAALACLRRLPLTWQLRQATSLEVMAATAQALACSQPRTLRLAQHCWRRACEVLRASGACWRDVAPPGAVSAHSGRSCGGEDVERAAAVVVVWVASKCEEPREHVAKASRAAALLPPPLAWLGGQAVLSLELTLMDLLAWELYLGLGSDPEDGA